jgi:hypothetical protein
MLAPRTGDSESGYWLTCPTPTVKGNYNKAGLSDKSGDGLATWAAQFPTPTSTPYGIRNNGHRPDGSTYRTAGAPSLDTMARRSMWPTPLATDGSHGGPNQAGGKGDLRLSSAVARSMWPTPTVQDASNNGAPSQMERNTQPLNAVAGGPLNPTWVEWLMGWPLGWTACDASATGRYLPARRKRGGSSSRACNSRLVTNATPPSS